jgi:hypothetical protein
MIDLSGTNTVTTHATVGQQNGYLQNYSYNISSNSGWSTTPPGFSGSFDSSQGVSFGYPSIQLSPSTPWPFSFFNNGTPCVYRFGLYVLARTTDGYYYTNWNYQEQDFYVTNKTKCQ